MCLSHYPGKLSIQLVCEYIMTTWTCSCKARKYFEDL